MNRQLSPKNIALGLLGASVLGLGTVVAVDHTVGAPQRAQPAALVASTASTSHIKGFGGAFLSPSRVAGMIASVLGVSPAALQTDIKNGETLDQIAGAKDAQVKSEALTALTSALDWLVKDGVLTKDQAKSLTADAQDTINQIFAAKLGKLFHRG